MIKLAKGKNQKNGWEIEIDEPKAIQEECEERGTSMYLDDIESVLLALISLGYLKAE
jgi:hypothetical protein